MTTTTTDVLIIGAGPTGLTMANMLNRNGVHIRIIDKKDSPSEETRAVVVHAKTLELLDKLDLADKAVAKGLREKAIRLLNEGRGASLLSFEGESERTPYPFPLMYPQNWTEHLLLNDLMEAGGQVEWNTEVVNMEQTPTGTRATLRQANGNEETIEAGWLVGADGAHSPVRRSLSLGFEGETYKQALFLADVDLADDLDGGHISIGFTRMGFLAFFPMPGDRRFRALGELPLELKDRDKLTIDEVQQIINTYRGQHIKIVRARWISVYRTHHRMSEHFRVGRVFLIGDAAHIHSPAGGQGMNTGIGDAYNLAWKLALVIKGKAHMSLLDSYEAERMPFARAILNGSDKGFHLMEKSQPIVQQIKMFGIPRFFRFVASIPALRKRAFWLLSQLWTSYRTSPAVLESVSNQKGPRAGDRAPYGFFETGPDAGQSIFHLLKGLDHHLFLFAGSKSDAVNTNLQEVETNLRTLVSTYATPIHVHVVSAGNASLHERYGANEPSLFLIRPDGHIAYHGLTKDVASLQSYLDGLFTRSTISLPAVERSRVL